MRKMLLGLVLLGAAAPSFAHPEDSAIDAVYERLRSARAAGSIEGMTAAFAPDAMLVDSRPGAPLLGSELGARLAPQVERLRGENGSIATEYRIERRQVSGDIALDAGYMRQTVNRPGHEPMTRYARFLVTMRRGASGWQIVGDASMPATEATWAALAPAAPAACGQGSR